jgi:hypothetical protein
MRPVKSVKKNQYQPIYNYIIKNIDSSDHGEKTTTPKSKIMFFYKTFNREYSYVIKKYGRFRALKEYLEGLPSTFHVDFENDKILDLNVRWGRITKNASEQKKDYILDTWFPFIAMRILELWQKNKI